MSLFDTGETVALTAIIQRPTPGGASSSLALGVGSLGSSGLAAGVVAVIVAGLLGLALVLLLRNKEEGVRERVGQFIGRGGGEQDAGMAILARAGEGRLRRTAWWQNFEREYEIARFDLSPAKLAAMVGGGCFVFGVLLAASTSVALIAVVPVLFTPALMWILVHTKANRERRRFGEQLADHLAVVAGALRAGLSLAGALAAVVDDAPEPTRREFRRASVDVDLGAELDEALERIAERMNSRDMEQVATLAGLQRESGTNAAEALEQVIKTIRDRQDLRRTVRTLTAQGRLTRWILSFLPLIVLLVLVVANPSFIDPLFTTTLGRVLLALGVAMDIAGSLIIRRIVNFEV
jgi:tight adherence protein B